MSAERLRALAIHVCADTVTSGPRRHWQPSLAARDTTRRAVTICAQIGIVEQRTLSGEGATASALRGALDDAIAALANHGLLVLTFSGHSERGTGPIETACWCLVGGGLPLSQLASQLARLPATARLVLVCDTCHASAIAHALLGPQPTVVLASCGEDQTMVDRPRSEFMVRLEAFFCSPRGPGRLGALRAWLETDTPACERPVVWSNVEQPAPWTERSAAIGDRAGGHRCGD